MSERPHRDASNVVPIRRWAKLDDDVVAATQGAIWCATREGLALVPHDPDALSALLGGLLPAAIMKEHIAALCAHGVLARRDTRHGPALAYVGPAPRGDEPDAKPKEPTPTPEPAPLPSTTRPPAPAPAPTPAPPPPAPPVVSAPVAPAPPTPAAPTPAAGRADADQLFELQVALDIEHERTVLYRVVAVIEALALLGLIRQLLMLELL